MGQDQMGESVVRSFLKRDLITGQTEYILTSDPNFNFYKCFHVEHVERIKEKVDLN